MLPPTWACHHVIETQHTFHTGMCGKKIASTANNATILCTMRGGLLFYTQLQTLTPNPPQILLHHDGVWPPKDCHSLVYTRQEIFMSTQAITVRFSPDWNANRPEQRVRMICTQRHNKPNVSRRIYQRQRSATCMKCPKHKIEQFFNGVWGLSPKATKK